MPHKLRHGLSDDPARPLRGFQRNRYRLVEIRRDRAIIGPARSGWAMRNAALNNGTYDGR
jgi:hypothetical protein